MEPQGHTVLLPGVSENHSLPRPGCVSSYRSLVHVPELQDHERAALNECLPVEIPQHLTLSKTWTRQADSTKTHFLNNMLSKFPWLARYEGAWPVEAFTMEWMARNRNRDREDWDRNLKYRRKQRQAQASQAAEVATRQNHHKTRSTSSALALRTERTAQAARLPPRTSALPASGSVSHGTKAVRRFLASLEPPLDGLTSVLRQGGLQEEAHLNALIEMTESQQRSFLERLPLTFFQVQLICNALQERRE